MEHLYVVGNGFDIHHNIPSRYVDFKSWLENNDNSTYSKLNECLGVWPEDDIWWNDFETNLGDVSGVKEYTENVAFENRPNYASDDYRDRDLYDAEVEVENDLGGLIDCLKYGFQQWASQLPYGEDGTELKIERENSVFLTFNYSLTLENLYGITSKQIVHIHGVCDDWKSIEVGHGRSYQDIRNEFDDNASGVSFVDPEDIIEEDFSTTRAKDAAASAVCGIRKDVKGIIERHKVFFDSLQDVEYVHIYGFSFAETDLPYLDAVFASLNPDRLHIEVSWFSDRDRKRIEMYLDKMSLLDKLSLVRLKDLEVYSCPSLF